MSKKDCIKYVLFDFDGTLIDTNELIILTLRETAKRFLGRELSEEELNSIFGNYLEDQMKYLSPDNYQEMMLFYRSFYKAHQDSMVKEFCGISEMLRDIKALHCKTAIVSAKGRSGILHGLDLLGLSEYIDVIVSSQDIQNKKPDPEPAFKAIELLNGNVELAVLVGDSPYDILCGKNAGIRTVLVDWTIFPKNEIYKLDPDFITKSPSELVEIIKNK